MSKKIEDFGQKIGGARKDMFHKGMRIEELADTTEAEKLKFITRNNLFPEPDYQKLYEEENIPKTVLMFRKNVRASLPVDLLKGNHKDRLNIKNSEEIQMYIDFIGEIQDLLDKVESLEDVKNFYKDRIVGTYGSVKGRYFYWSTKTSELFLTNKFLKAVQRNSELQLEEDIKRKDFLLPKSKSAANKFEIRKQTDSSFIVTNTKTKAIIDICNTLEEAEKVCEEAEKKSSRRKGFVPPQLEHIERSGVKYRRLGYITGSDFLKTFHFKGGEFGNWLSQNDREVSLRYGYDAFLDLAKALNISPENISLDGNLSIAFGSRGRKGALAHYESLRTVINLTKMKGAGSLAHEWGHALDDFLGKKYIQEGRSFLSDKAHTMPEMLALWKAMCRNGYEQTDYYKSSIAFDKMFHPSKPYWSSPVEMFARAFSCYVQDKLQELGIRSDYLCGHSDLNQAYSREKQEMIYAYPRGEERSRINQAFDALILQIHKDGYFQDYHPENYEMPEVEVQKEQTEYIYSSCALPEAPDGQLMLFDMDDLEK